MSKLHKFALLATLYLAQGLPYGFFTQALPVFLRKANIGLPAIGASYLLTLPWALKFLWAPVMDRKQAMGLGLRRSWLLPLQTFSVLLFIALSFVSPDENLTFVLCAFLLTNLIAASQDIATDGLAVDLLEKNERGWANGIQVAGYRVGMIIGGGLILTLFDQIGWTGAMLSMAGIAFACTWPVVTFRERPREASREARPIRTTSDALRETVHFFLKPGAASWILVLLLYKTGHASATGMLRPWLVDQGYSLTDIAWLLGTAGFVAGFGGALTGGALASRFNRKKLLVLLGVLQTAAVTSYLLPVLTTHATWKVVMAAALDHFSSGMATATLFTLMMDACDRDRAASDYTVQACLVVIATGAAGGVSGLSAGLLGYQTHFALSSAFAVVAILAVTWLVSRADVRRLLG